MSKDFEQASKERCEQSQMLLNNSKELTASWRDFFVLYLNSIDKLTPEERSVITSWLKMVSTPIIISTKK